MWVKARSLFRTRERSRGRDLPAVMTEREMQPARVTHAGAADAIGAGTIVVALREFDWVISRPEYQSLA